MRGHDSRLPKPDETYDLPLYEPLWAAAQDLGMPLSLHVGTKRPGLGVAQMRTDGKVTQSAAERSVTDYWVRLSLGHMVFSGIFERFPDLRVVNVEHELSWIPFFMKRMDTTYVERHSQATHRYSSDALPSDFMHGTSTTVFRRTNSASASGTSSASIG